MKATLNDWEYRLSENSWGKYDSGFHAWLVECCEPDEYFGDSDFGGASLFGHRIDWWTSTGFHFLDVYKSASEARQAYDEAERKFYDEYGDEYY